MEEALLQPIAFYSISDDYLLQLFEVRVCETFFVIYLCVVLGLDWWAACPDFSNGGKNKGFAGENGRLTKTFIELIDEMHPPFFPIENVSGFFRIKKHRSFWEELKTELQKNGYLVQRKTKRSNVPHP